MESLGSSFHFMDNFGHEDPSLRVSQTTGHPAAPFSQISTGETQPSTTLQGSLIIPNTNTHPANHFPLHLPSPYHPYLPPFNGTHIAPGSGNAAPPQMLPYYPRNALYSPSVATHSVLSINTTATNVNNSHETQTRTQAGKRKRTTGGVGATAPSRTNKRQRQVAQSNTVPISPPRGCGVGPSTRPQLHDENRNPNAKPSHGLTIQINDIPLESESSSAANVEKSARFNHLPAAATDVWYFLRGLQTHIEPPDSDKLKNDTILTRKPSTPYVGCKLCTTTWKVWKLSDGMTTTFRDHLKKYHSETYTTTVQVKNLKHSSKPLPLDSTNSKLSDEPFSKVRFLELLQKWIVADDQSINVLECEEFRNLMLYVGDGNIEDKDLPHRTKMTDLILDAFHKRVAATIDEFKRSEGRISFTSDLWSDPVLDSFMAVTAHYLIRDEKTRRLIWRSGLVAFRFIEGSHTGANLAQKFTAILKELGALHKIGVITLDNASNNNTFMREIEQTLTEQSIKFDKDANRIRCFPHVVNIACQTILNELKKGDLSFLQMPIIDPLVNVINDPAEKAELEEDQLNNWMEYLAALEADLVGKCRSIVAACRVSGQRRQALLKKIDEGNKSGYWQGKLDNGKDQIPLLQLLRDCETRWSSSFNMIDRVLVLYAAIRDFLLDLEQRDLHQLILSELEKNVLYDIHQVLQVAHLAQELLCAERTPTLSMALPIYETLITKWRELSVTIPELKYFIDIGITKLEEYLAETRKTRIYSLSMVLNPGQKFSWLKTYDEKPGSNGNYEKNARKWVLEAMLDYKQHERSTHEASRTRSTVGQHTSGTELASSNVAYGYSRLQTLDVTIRRSSSLQSIQTSSASRSRSNTPDPLSLHTSSHDINETADEAIVRRSRELAEDKAFVELELSRYEAASAISSFDGTGMVDIVEFWSMYEHQFPMLYRVAMDILPAQASAVPCERVFSSSKETCALRRNRISRRLLEALQVLKYSYRSERLSFIEDLVAKEVDYAIAGPITATAIDELMAAGKYEELNQLTANANES